jgi:hypothetical protein
MANYKKWNETELVFIRENISILSDTELANKLSQITGQNISYGMIRRQRRKIGVKKKRGRRKKNSISPLTSEKIN